MEEIKVGEYVRTKEGNIFKITNYGLGETAKGDVLLVELNKDFEMEYCNLDIVKHSKNIIDLVEVGDYVNGYKVKYVCNEEPCPSGKYVDVDCELDSSESYFFDNEIKSIVTKEQFANAEYRLED